MPSVAVLVPVVGRPQSAGRFMDSFRASTGPEAQVLAIAERDDPATTQAWQEAGAEVADQHNWRTFAEKINFGYRITESDWIFLVGDDVWFHPGWLEAAFREPGNPKVIGIRDSEEPSPDRRVGHLLIERRYIDEQGASWDGPGIVCHPYQHNYVDDEIIFAAHQRGLYAYCAEGYVEHLHPNMGKAAPDAVYQRSWNTAEADWRLWQRRSAEHMKVAR